MQEQTKKLFLALWPDTREQARFHSLARQYKPTAQCRLVGAHRLHLTLLFLGPVNTATEKCVREIADAIAWHPLKIEFDRLGWFAQPRVMWIGCSNPPAQLRTLVDDLETGMAQCGFESERRDYQPHISVARKVTQPPQAKEIEATTCCFKSFSLVESRMDQSGADYIRLASWPTYSAE